MTVQEKLERLKREKTPHSTEELDRLGWARYEGIHGELEAKHHGEYVMIEVDSGDYFGGRPPGSAGSSASRPPEQSFLLDPDRLQSRP